MKQFLTCLLILSLLLGGCRTYIESKQTNYSYIDNIVSDTVSLPPLHAVTNEEYLQFGVDVAYLNFEGDTIIGFGQFAYFGTDTLKYFANVLLHPNEQTHGRIVGINRKGEVLFDLYIFDNGPDYYNEGLIRVKRNNKLGYANVKGEIVIPCQYAFGSSFENGTAQVTYEGRTYYDGDEHIRVESDSWFKIDKAGNPVAP